MVIDILQEATAWLERRGIRWWASGFPHGKIRESVHRGEVYLAYVDGEAAATITVDFRRDPELWADVGDDAGYARRMAVRRKWAGRGLGPVLLDWAGHVVASAGRACLRLDANKDNLGLHVYYKRLGFHYVGTVDLPHRNTGALFQRPAQPLSRFTSAEAPAS